MKLELVKKDMEETNNNLNSLIGKIKIWDNFEEISIFIITICGILGASLSCTGAFCLKL